MKKLYNEISEKFSTQDLQKLHELTKEYQHYSHLNVYSSKYGFSYKELEEYCEWYLTNEDVNTIPSESSNITNINPTTSLIERPTGEDLIEYLNWLRKSTWEINANVVEATLSLSEIVRYDPNSIAMENLQQYLKMLETSQKIFQSQFDIKNLINRELNMEILKSLGYKIIPPEE